MKKIIIAVLLLISINGLAQVDSFAIKTSVSLQVRDWLFLNTFLANREEFENVYDSMKVRLRVAVAPNLTTVIKVDSVKQGQILSLARMLKSGPYGIVAFAYTRVNNALKSNPFLTYRIDAMDADYTTQYNARVQGELDKLRAVLNN